MSQKAIAEQLGIHYNSYARFERGVSTPRPSTYDKLAEVYGCSKEYLMDVDDNKKKASAKASSSKANKKPAAASKKADNKPAEKEAEPVKEVKSVPQVNIELQYAGKNISYTDIIERAKSASGSDGEGMDIYIKPEEDRVYYVVKGVPGSFEI
ncbi:MAG: helix-turn-helix domain-containing protein [Lachnospiraceae bacterium]|nr:helix-turn-helix domain-containing protein [Lachnospiraceae bacterium]